MTYIWHIHCHFLSEHASHSVHRQTEQAQNFHHFVFLHVAEAAGGNSDSHFRNKAGLCIKFYFGRFPSSVQLHQMGLAWCLSLQCCYSFSCGSLNKNSLSSKLSGGGS